MNWLRRMMIGRYGADQLSVALFIFYLLLAFITQFMRLNYFLYSVFVLISFIPLALCFFRMLSRNTSKRYQENYRFLKWWNPTAQWFRNLGARMNDRKTHRYYKCPNCSSTLRVPKGKGKICITCPVCRKEFIKKT